VSLVTPGEGREDTRARISLPADPLMLAVVETFAGTEARLIVTGDAAGRRSAEVSHEALIRHWEKLRTWVDENRESLRVYAALAADRAEWLKQKKDASLLIEPGLRLEAARKLRDQPGDVVIEDIRDYIDASLARDARLRLWRGVGLAVAVVVAIVMSGLAWWALEAQQTAQDERDTANRAQQMAQEQRDAARRQKQFAVVNEARALSALSRVALSNHQMVDALKLALAAWPRSVDDDRPRLEITLNAISAALSTELLPIRESKHDGQAVGARFVRGEEGILSWSIDGTLLLWDAATGQPIGPAMRHEGGVVGAVLTQSEGRILSWSDDGTLRLWDAATGQPIGPAMRHEGRVVGAVLTQSEGRILSWSDDGTLRLWDIVWPRGNLLEVACSRLPNQDLTDISKRYGISITEPICDPKQTNSPLDWSEWSKAGKMGAGGFPFIGTEARTSE
jgi:hypothetical protein